MPKDAVEILKFQEIVVLFVRKIRFKKIENIMTRTFENCTWF